MPNNTLHTRTYSNGAYPPSTETTEAGLLVSVQAQYDHHVTSRVSHHIHSQHDKVEPLVTLVAKGVARELRVKERMCRIHIKIYGGITDSKYSKLEKMLEK